ncbi:helix-turn-helix transcriptional regulator [Micromonospora sp. NPDC049366]|uniref:helix-turn-helix transcriptional regulator n=1 Tax=Micromonospora sp. NPDC049366 TaxID=3364271 RepID=UPI00378AA653
MEPRIGDHLARIRRQAGMSQEALAERSGVSLSTIQQLEQHKRTSARLATLSALAAALSVDTTALMGNAAPAVDQREPDAMPIGLVGVRRALTPVYGLDGQPLDADPAGLPPTVAGVTTAVRDANRVYHGNDYAAALAGLPRLLGQARALVDTTSGDDQATAHTLASRAHQLAGRLLIQLRQVDLAHVALDGALRHARHSSDQLAGAESVAAMCWLLMRVGRFDDARALAVRTADQVEPKMSKATPADLAAWGFLLMKAAAAAVRDARRDEATELLDLAAGGAQVLGDRPNPYADVAGNDFSAEGVHLMRVESAVIAGQPARALALAERVTRSPQVTPSSRQRHRLDVAWSYVQTGQYADATGVLLDLRDTAPSWLRQQPYARTIVAELVDTRRRALSAELAELTSLVGYAP